MNTRFWRHVCVLTLGVLLVAPMVVAETTIPLAWYAPEDGIKRGPADEEKTVFTANEVTFTKPTEKDCKGSDFKNTVEGEELVDGKLNPRTQVKCKKEGDNNCVRFVTKTASEFRVYCYDTEEIKHRYPISLTESALQVEGVFCELSDLSRITQTWEPIFIKDKSGKDIDKKVGGKAIPWNKDGDKAYCPDPILHSKAYDLLVDDKGNVPEYAQVSAELVRRSTLEACFRVVDAYKIACMDKLGGIQGEQSGFKRGKITNIEKSKDKAIKTITGEEDKDTRIKKWNVIKDRTRDVLLSSKNKVKENDFFTDELGLKAAFTAWSGVNDNIKGWGGSQKLKEFIEKQSEAAYTKTDDGKAYAGNISGKKNEANEVQQIINFLQKRSISIQMANALNATKTFQVTKWLRRNNTSEENKLTLIGNTSEDTNILDKVIKLAAQILGSLGVLLLIISAVMMVVSQGEETMLQKAKQTFLYTLIGLIVAFFSYTIVRFILEFLLIR